MRAAFRLTKTGSLRENGNFRDYDDNPDHCGMEPAFLDLEIRGNEAHGDDDGNVDPWVRDITHVVRHANVGGDVAAGQVSDMRNDVGSGQPVHGTNQDAPEPDRNPCDPSSPQDHAQQRLHIPSCPDICDLHTVRYTHYTADGTHRGEMSRERWPALMWFFF